MIVTLIVTLLFSANQTYRISGLESPPSFSHHTINQEVRVFSHESSLYMKITVHRTAVTPVTRIVDKALKGMDKNPGDDCRVLSKRLCSLLSAENVSCSEISGLLYTTSFPASSADLYVPSVHGIPHRWVEYYDPQQGWIGVDPVHPNGKISEYHIPVSVIDNWPGIRVEAVKWD